MKAILSIVVLTVAALMCAAATADDTASDYTLAAGDRIRITVYGHDDLSGEFQLDGSGNIALPLIQTVAAGGQTPRALEQTITDRLQPEYLRNPLVSVEVVTQRPFYILGEVSAPGSYPYSTGITVVKAAALAGGFTYRANTKKVRITRDGDAEPIERAPLQSEIKPGDVIEVPERFF
ncbi:MAG TPA: polysaccharide biosynthesis/export family protein [Vicinamibacterales bacterium]|nr:polysaccharide biosynthesis/export family protein [Polyangiaceae bacterium]HYJ94247.1 polysaccharide biosynthesis/export family protein [Vicinamibacterales bacterium]